MPASKGVKVGRLEADNSEGFDETESKADDDAWEEDISNVEKVWVLTEAEMGLCLEFKAHFSNSSLCWSFTIVESKLSTSSDFF